MDKSQLLEDLATISAELRGREPTPEDIESMSADVRRLSEKVTGARPVQSKRTLRDLKGVGKDIWSAIDVDEYIRRERDSWR